MSRRWLWLLPLLALALRVAWLSRFPADPLEPVDARGYHLLAQNLAAGNGFSLDRTAPFCPASIRTPFYPVFLAGVYALLGEDPVRVVGIQLLLEALTTALVVRLGCSVGGPRTGAPAGLLYAVNLTSFHYVGALWSEMVLLPLLTAALGATVGWLRRPTGWRSLGAGLLWGGVLLAKPNAQFLVIGIAGIGWLSLWAGWGGRRHVRRSGGWHAPALFALALGLVVAPWIGRNWRLAGRPMLSTAFEENLSRVSAVATLAGAQGIAAEPWTPTWEHLYLELVSQAAERYQWSSWDEARLSCAEREEHHRQIAVVAGEWVRAHPAAMIQAHLNGVALSLSDVGHKRFYRLLTGRSWAETGVVDDLWGRMGESLRIGAVGDALNVLWQERIVRIPRPAALIWWGLLAGRLLLWGIGLRGAWRLRTQPAVLLVWVGVIGYHIGLPGPIAYDRFYLPAVPAVVVLAARGMGWGRSSRDA